MQEVMRIGNEFVIADDDIKDVSNTSTAITDAAHKFKTDVLAIIGKGDKHLLVTQSREQETLLADDIVKVILLIHTLADTYKVNARDIAEAINYVMKEGE